MRAAHLIFAAARSSPPPVARRLEASSSPRQRSNVTCRATKLRGVSRKPVTAWSEFGFVGFCGAFRRGGRRRRVETSMHIAARDERAIDTE